MGGTEDTEITIPLDSNHKHKKILIRRVDSLGDVILALPIIRELKRIFPNAAMSVMVKPEHRGVLFRYAESFPDPIPLGKITRLRRRYDLIANIEYSFPDGYTPGPIRDRRIIHIGTPDWGKKQHVYRHLLDGLAAHSLKPRFNRPKVYVPPGKRAEAERWLIENGIEPEESFSVAVSPGSAWRFKKWMLPGFIRISKWLIAEFGARIIVVSRSRKDQCSRKLFRALPAGKVSWLANRGVDFVGTVLSMVDMAVGNDSGIGHLAAAVGTPTVTIFGPTSAGLWKPVARNSVVVYSRDSECRACGYEMGTKCKSQICLKSITVHDVADAIMTCINKFVGRGSRGSLDHVRVADSLKIDFAEDGIRLVNERIPRYLIVRSGFDHVSRVLRQIEKTGSYSATLRQSPKDRHLLGFLLLHRIIISASKRKYNRHL